MSVIESYPSPTYQIKDLHLDSPILWKKRKTKTLEIHIKHTHRGLNGKFSIIWKESHTHHVEIYMLKILY